MTTSTPPAIVGISNALRCGCSVAGRIGSACVVVVSGSILNGGSMNPAGSGARDVAGIGSTLTGLVATGSPGATCSVLTSSWR